MGDGHVSSLIDLLVGELQRVPGVAAIVLGGSRARGTHTPQSDIDLALYYRPDHPLDLTRLGGLATAVDDAHRAGIMTAIGGWGPWINGGGWLTVQEWPVDLLYRDLDTVTATVEECSAGRPRIVYQPGHPHGFITSIYLAEVALCRVLWDPAGIITALKRRAAPYPVALRSALVQQFFWEASFSLAIAAKAIPRADVSYVAGCCFRAVSCLTQALFALNRTYWMNEKGATALAGTFALVPPHFSERVAAAFGLLEAEQGALTLALEQLAGLTAETGALLAAAGLTS